MSREAILSMVSRIERIADMLPAVIWCWASMHVASAAPTSRVLTSTPTTDQVLETNSADLAEDSGEKAQAAPNTGKAIIARAL